MFWRMQYLPKSVDSENIRDIIMPRVWLTTDRAWIGSRIWLLQFVNASTNSSSWIYTVYNSLRHTIAFIFTSPLVTISNDGHFRSFGFQNCPHPSATAILSWLLIQLLLSQEHSLQNQSLFAIQDVFFTSRTEMLSLSYPSGDHDQIFITVQHLRFSRFRAPSLARGLPVIYTDNCYSALPALTALGPSSAELVTVSHSHFGFPQPGGPGPRIYIRQEQGGPVIPSPGNWFPLCRFPRLAELWWRYSNPPPREFSYPGWGWG
jgi:hypothetical protein